MIILGYFSLVLHENIWSLYSLEMPQEGASNEYPQDMFLWRNKKTISRNNHQILLLNELSVN